MADPANDMMSTPDPHPQGGAAGCRAAHRSPRSRALPHAGLTSSDGDAMVSNARGPPIRIGTVAGQIAKETDGIQLLSIDHHKYSFGGCADVPQVRGEPQFTCSWAIQTLVRLHTARHKTRL